MQMDDGSISLWDLGCPISMLSNFFSFSDRQRQTNIQGVTVK